jgi:hypothetical protein
MPIMELHFLIFTWIPYMKLQKMTLTGAFILNYIESIFYGYQVYVYRHAYILHYQTFLFTIGFYGICNICFNSA